MKRKFLDVTKYYCEAEQVARQRRRFAGEEVKWSDVLHECIINGLNRQRRIK